MTHLPPFLSLSKCQVTLVIPSPSAASLPPIFGSAVYLGRINQKIETLLDPINENWAAGMCLFKISLPGQGKDWRCRDVGPVIKPWTLPIFRKKSPISARERAGKTPPKLGSGRTHLCGYRAGSSLFACSLEGEQGNDEGEGEGFGSGGGHKSRMRALRRLEVQQLLWVGPMTYLPPATAWAPPPSLSPSPAPHTAPWEPFPANYLHPGPLWALLSGPPRIRQERKIALVF